MADSEVSVQSVNHDPVARRFLLVVDGHEAVVDYEHRDGTMVITHTVVPQAIGGRGIAGVLVRAALEHARGQGMKVVPQCSYAEAFMRRHGEYTDLLG